jgi:predicted N-acetyltransferase YhbS
VGINIRPIAPDEFLPFARADSAAFGFEVVPERMEDTKQIFEFDRTLAAFDGEEIVGTTAIFSFTTTTPGGALPTAGVTWVSVKPTHRRQGILTQVMRRQLSDVRERGEPIASLWASESLIYGRFGYGLAAEAVALEIEREHTRLGRGAEACGRCRLIDLEEALRSWPRVYDRVLPGQPGMYSRSETWWKHKALSEFDFSRQAGTRFFAQYEEDGEPLGYARYRVKGDSQLGVLDHLPLLFVTGGKTLDEGREVSLVFGDRFFEHHRFPESYEFAVPVGEVGRDNGHRAGKREVARAGFFGRHQLRVLLAAGWKVFRLRAPHQECPGSEGREVCRHRSSHCQLLRSRSSRPNKTSGCNTCCRSCRRSSRRCVNDRKLRIPCNR